MSQQFILVFAALLGMLGIIFGAFGAHLLKKKLTSEQLTSFETGVKYQMYHAITLLTLGFQYNIELNTALWCFTVGIILFSFSIYGLVLSDAFGKKLKILGPITPLGGLLLVAGWFLIALQFIL